MIVRLDDRRRITLPAEARLAPGDDVELTLLEEGKVMLTPMVRVPKSKLKVGFF